MHEIAYTVRGFLTVRQDSLRIPLNGSLAVHADLDSGRFTGDLVLDRSAVSRRLLGASLFSATVQITADSPVTGAIDHEGRMDATVTVDAVIAAVRAAGRVLIDGGSCRTAAHAIVPLRSEVRSAAAWWFPANTSPISAGTRRDRSDPCSASSLPRSRSVTRAPR
jgi:hypothetical protein